MDEVSKLILFWFHLPHGHHTVMQSHSTTFGSVRALARACTYILINQEKRLDARSAPLKIQLSLALFRSITLFVVSSLELFCLFPSRPLFAC